MPNARIEGRLEGFIVIMSESVQFYYEIQLSSELLIALQHMGQQAMNIGMYRIFFSIQKQHLN